MKKKIIVVMTMLLILSISMSFAANSDSIQNNEVAIRDINYVESMLQGIYPASVEFDHDSGIRYDGSIRQVWGRTQGWQENGQYKMSSYTRAYFQQLGTGTIRADSGREYSTGTGPSYAESGWMVNDLSYIAKTKYGS